MKINDTYCLAQQKASALRYQTLEINQECYYTCTLVKCAREQTQALNNDCVAEKLNNDCVAKKAKNKECFIPIC